MNTSASTLPVMAVWLMFNAVVSGVGQERIPELQRDSSPRANSITLTGCVTRGTEPGTYTLTNVTKSGDGSTKDAARPLTVVLAAADVDFSKHVDHMVSVTGSQAFDKRLIGTTETEKSAVRKQNDKQRPATFTVTALRMVAVSCASPAV